MKYILITGAARGIGYGLSHVCLQNGDYVVACDRNLPSEEMNALRESYPERIMAIQMDVASTASVNSAAQQIQNAVPYLDIIINNAGIKAEDDTAPLDEFSVDNCLEVYNINALGMLRVTQALYPMLEKGKTKILLNISSNGASIADVAERKRDKNWDYCMAKAAENMGSCIFQNALYDKGIKVLAIHPGWVRTDMGGQNQPLSPEESAKGILKTALCYQGLLNGPLFMDYTGRPMHY